jgi:hypothetical protein
MACSSDALLSTLAAIQLERISSRMPTLTQVHTKVKSPFVSGKPQKAVILNKAQV